MKGVACPLRTYLSIFWFLKVILFLCICDLNVLLDVFTENSLGVFFIKLKWFYLNVISYCFLKISCSATFLLSGICLVQIDDIELVLIGDT